MSPMSLETEIVSDILRHKWGGGAGPREGVLIVHSAFRSLSRQGVKAEAFCAALLDALFGTTLLMPTMTWRSVTPAAPVFDEMATPSHTGILTEVFRTRFASHRSLHPTHSVAGAGPLAALLLGTHHQGTTPCAGNSPYGLIRDYPTLILMLGTGMETCTAIHHAEEVMASELYVEPPEWAEAYRLIDRTGKVHPVLTRRHRRLPRDFPALVPILEQSGRLLRGRSLGLNWLLFSAGDLYQLVFSRLSQCRAATLRKDLADAACP
ncbi:Aminoglycoside N(3)-acetyltransferase [uncultured Gammaproteobacteria bacterium]